MRRITAVFAVTRCLSVCLSRSWITSKRINISSNFFHHRDTILVLPSQRGCRYSDGNPPNRGVECEGYDKITIFSHLRNGNSYMGTCSETICKHRILFPSIQHLAWLPQGRPQGKQKCGKIAIFGLKHRITRKLLNIDRYMLRGVWQALNFLSIYATCCVIVAGTPRETKMWAAVRENGDFLHLQFE